MKTAILLIGNIRTWASCKESFISTFGHLNADIYVSTYNLQYGHHPWIKQTINDFGDDIITSEQITDMFKDMGRVNISVEDHKMNEDLINHENQFKIHPMLKNQFNSYGQCRKLLLACEMAKATEEREHFQYDLMIKTRCDLVYNPIDKNKFYDLPKNKIIVDGGNVYPNDCILITSRDNMMHLSKFMFDEFYSPRYENSHLNPPHGLLYNATKYCNLEIETLPMMYYVIRRGERKQYY